MDNFREWWSVTLYPIVHPWQYESVNKGLSINFHINKMHKTFSHHSHYKNLTTDGAPNFQIYFPKRAESATMRIVEQFDLDSPHTTSNGTSKDAFVLYILSPTTFPSWTTSFISQESAKCRSSFKNTTRGYWMGVRCVTCCGGCRMWLRGIWSLLPYLKAQIWLNTSCFTITMELGQEGDVRTIYFDFSIY